MAWLDYAGSVHRQISDERSAAENKLLRKLVRQAYAAFSLVDRLTGCPEPERWSDRRSSAVGSRYASMSWDQLLPRYQQPPKKKEFKNWTVTFSSGVTMDHLASSDIAAAIADMRSKLRDMHVILGHSESLSPEC